MTSTSLNPYAVLPSDAVDTPAPPPAPEPWKAIAWRWEKLRLFYNLAVGVCGIPALIVAVAALRPIEAAAAFIGALGYGIAANVCYLFGPIVEMYLNWLGDFGERRRWMPAFLLRLVRGRFFTLVMWSCGTAASMLLTLLMALGFAFSLAIHQP